MAVIVAGNFAIDMNAPEIGALAEGTPTTATATRFVLTTDAFLDEFTGSFQYSNGSLVGGTLTGWKESYSGQLLFQISGASVPVTTFLQWVATDANITAVSTIPSGADQITGSPEGDNLYGYAGDDLIAGGGGADSLEGGAGNDTVNGNLGDDLIREVSGSNYLRGDEGNDSIVGGTGFDDINGNMGADTASGGAGTDWVVGGKDNDLLFGDSGDDIVYGNLGNDTCEGGDGNDIVRGGQDDDVVRGGAGDDFISGDRGNDTLTGGAGADTFHTFGENGTDRVTDFNAAQGDRVMLLAGETYSAAQVGADTVITMGAGGTMTLVGVQLSTLPPGWIFGN